ncbi:hypothetical protein T484DRAFT_1799220 [Baffinella frigidus]|nr:hypothetical protein T484DRAFT_1799220 [Cryptophyta sp. CCMP2293]
MPARAAGLCECDERWRGVSCNLTCPQKDGVVCAGNGICDYAGNCSCTRGFRGAACAVECTGGSQNPCNGHGTCGEDGRCTCRKGWVGERCHIECPGGEAAPCSNQGACVSDGEYSRCVCTVDPYAVVSSFHGAACTAKVYNAVDLQQAIVDRAALFPKAEDWLMYIGPGAVMGTVGVYFLLHFYDVLQQRRAHKEAFLQERIRMLTLGSDALR